ncbi:aminoglycoside phosphotransferase family protein [Legionella saoudiensis]|uniref:aminoglycoside phosphotransferase family protein n=1 Tax=Legionella saoudiensis TaxID=1750561 RepID=UPI00098F713F|nr:aminoglycoside phosphotransferase family protein [Legionella saoudiensis]
MKIFQKNITNLYGSQGAEWIANLPQLITTLTNHWDLSEVIAVSNMTFNYVAKARLHTNVPVVLKISYDKQSILMEQQALASLGLGSIQLIDYSSKYNALLLQQAVPGITLKSLYKEDPDYVMDCYIKTMQKLHLHQQPVHSNFTHVAHWLNAFDNPSLQIPPALLNKAITLRNRLLASPKQLILLHGDLHHDNILKHGNEWLAIDPKGVVGETEFELAAFDFLYINELVTAPDVKKLFEKRVELLALKSGLDAQRIKDWVFVRLILMAVWFMEDNGDPSWAIKLAELIYE